PLPRLGGTHRPPGRRLAGARALHPRASLPLPPRAPGPPRARPRTPDRPRVPDQSLCRGAGARGDVGRMAERADALIIGGGVLMRTPSPLLLRSWPPGGVTLHRLL